MFGTLRHSYCLGTLIKVRRPYALLLTALSGGIRKKPLIGDMYKYSNDSTRLWGQNVALELVRQGIGQLTDNTGVTVRASRKVRSGSISPTMAVSLLVNDHFIFLHLWKVIPHRLEAHMFDPWPSEWGMSWVQRDLLLDHACLTIMQKRLLLQGKPVDFVKARPAGEFPH